eukprot:7305519-Prorocentrum_lima.AAC.1
MQAALDLVQAEPATTATGTSTPPLIPAAAFGSAGVVERPAITAVPTPKPMPPVVPADAFGSAGAA